MVLATDLAVHKQYLNKLDTLIDEISLEDKEVNDGILCKKSIPEENDKRLLLLAAVIKASDIGHPFKNLESHKIWSKYVNDEFAVQAKQEELRGLPISFDVNINNQENKFVQSQIGFLKFLVDPLYYIIYFLEFKK